MWSKRTLLAFGAALCTSGCALVQDSAHVATTNLAQVCEDWTEWRRNVRWAEDAWQIEQAGSYPSSADFARGFKDGFADFLYRGGNGEPPALPPASYRAIGYQTPQGYQAVQDWFAGFRRGATVARNSGYRDLVTGPSSLLSPTGTAPSEVLPAPQPTPVAVRPAASPIKPVQYEYSPADYAPVWKPLY